MSKIDPEFRLMRFSTDQLPVRERLDVWRDLISRKLWRFSIDQLSETPYRAKAALRAMPGMKVGMGMVSAAVHHRTREIAATENDDIALLVNLDGVVQVKRAGEELTLTKGDGLLVGCREVGVYTSMEAGRQLVIRLSPGALGAFQSHVGPALGRVIPARRESLSLLTGYAKTLPTGEREFSPPATQLVTDHISDLMALIVGASGDAAEQARGRGVAAARLGAVKAAIREGIGRPDLSMLDVAATHGISPRYLRQLFEAEGQSFTGYVLEQRLTQAHAMITSRRFATEPISKIAFEVGFGDLSYFNHSFRRRFERTPREARAEAARYWQDDETPKRA
jgi:AraC-like DNA-binding protein